MKHLTTLLILITLTGCYTAKQARRKFCPVQSEKHFKEITTLKQKEVKDSSRIIAATLNTIFLTSPCDSITGKLKKGIILTAGSGNNKTTLKTSDTGIVVTSNCDEQINYWRTLYEKESKKEVEIKEKVIRIEPTFWDYLKYAGIGIVVGVVLCFVLRMIFKRR